MKIALKLNMSQLHELVKILQENRIISEPLNIAQKANSYLFNEAFKKLLRKQIDKEGTDAKGKFTLKFSYAEAASLYIGLQAVDIRDDYRMCVWVYVTSELHKNLQ